MNLKHRPWYLHRPQFHVQVATKRRIEMKNSRSKIPDIYLKFVLKTRERKKKKVGGKSHLHNQWKVFWMTYKCPISCKIGRDLGKRATS